MYSVFQTCTYVYDSGTSMSCPTVAGATALLRQYFTDGYYPKGIKVPTLFSIHLYYRLRLMQWRLQELWWRQCWFTVAKVWLVMPFMMVYASNRNAFSLCVLWNELIMVDSVTAVNGNAYVQGFNGRVTLDSVLMFPSSEFSLFIVDKQGTHVNIA